MSLIGTILAVALLLIGVLISVFVSRNETQRMTERQEKATREIADLTADYFNETIAVLDIIGSAELNFPGGTAEVIRVMLENNPSILEIIKFDADNQVVASAYINVPIISNVTDLQHSPWYTDAKKGITHISDVRHPSYSSPYIVIAIPTQSDGVIVARVAQAEFQEIISLLSLGETGIAFIANSQGEMIAHPNTEYLKLEDVFSGFPNSEWEPDITTLFNLGTYQNLDQTLVIGMAAPLIGTDWAVFSEIDLSEAQASTRLAFTILFIGIVIFGSIILLAISVFMKSVLTKRLDVINTSVKEFGRGKLDQPIMVDIDDDIGSLAGAFNEMMDKLSNRESSLQQEIFERTRAESALTELNELLEQKVKDRTSEIEFTNRQLQMEIAERKRIEQQLMHDALHDSLTGLPNRALFYDRLERVIERIKRNPDDLYAVLFLDLDNFKVVNDSLGHKYGDDLLIAIARRLESVLRPTDTVARLGGDEFVILLEEFNVIDDATVVADRVLGELSQPFKLGEHTTYPTTSIGIVLSDGSYSRPAEILRDADIAMYHAKSRGRSRYAILDTQIRDKAMARLDLENDLRLAIENKEFILHFQPIVSLESGQLIGFEVLLRWDHPSRGLLLPQEFIPLSEETGLIVPLGDWILGESCSLLKTWHHAYPSEPPLSINVNISRVQFTSGSLVESIKDILKETGLEGKFLRLEITESVVMNSSETAIDTIQELQKLGISIDMDDFGTGYSSLSDIHHLPLDAIKIDQSFIKRIGFHGEKSDIVRTIITLAQDLKVPVIAEGVESQDQVTRLKDLDCQFAQGNIFSKPLTQSKITDMLSSSNPVTLPLEEQED